MGVNDWEKATLLRALRGEPLVTNSAEKNALRILTTKVDMLLIVNPMTTAASPNWEQEGFERITDKLAPRNKYAGSLLHGDWEPQ